LLAAAAVVIAGAPPFLGGCRALELVAARSLLDVELPEPVPGQRIDRETRPRSALWIALHLLAGEVVALCLMSVVPMALFLLAAQFGVRMAAGPGQPFGPLEAQHGVVAALFGVLAVAASVYGVAGLGTVARSMAPTLLGASQTEWIAALEARAERLAERDRLARELHDSIGHALTVTTLQAATARELLDSDTGFAREALRTI
jgi:signal transduction histidine kinase